jgi:ABC-type glutathione transport system ATPase component
MSGVTSIPSIEDRTMLSGVMEHFGLSKSFTQAEGFETDHHRQVLKDLQVAIYEGGIIALTGIVGSGKTVLLGRLQDQLRDEGEFAVSDSLTFSVQREPLSLVPRQTPWHFFVPRQRLQTTPASFLLISHCFI